MPRLTFDADEVFTANLNKLVNGTSATSKAEVIRNAVAVYRYLKHAVPVNEATGQQVIDIPSPDGAKIKMLIP